MKAQKFLLVATLFVVIGVLGGCHYGSYDDHRSYGYSSGYSRSGTSYRDGFRDGRAYERRNEEVRDRYSSDWWRRRW